MISSSSDIPVVVGAHEVITVVVVFIVTFSSSIEAGVVVKGPCPVGNVFTVTLGDIVFIVTLSSSSEKVDWSIVLFILDPVLVEVLVRGVALWVLFLVV